MNDLRLRCRGHAQSQPSPKWYSYSHTAGPPGLEVPVEAPITVPSLLFCRCGHEPTRMTTVGDFEIGEIDFRGLVDLLFWDTNFLAGEEMTKLTAKQRDQLGLGAETFGLAAGLPPHPEGLRLELVEAASPEA